MHAPVPHHKPASWRRWLGIALRSAHLASAVLLGASLMGAAHEITRLGALAVWLTGLGLLASEWFDSRVHLSELAGLVVLLKLALVAWIALDVQNALILFWGVMLLSAVSSHAPRALRHWRPRR